MAKKRRPTSDAVDILHRRYFEGKPQRLAELADERANAQVAREPSRPSHRSRAQSTRIGQTRRHDRVGHLSAGRRRLRRAHSSRCCAALRAFCDGEWTFDSFR